MFIIKDDLSESYIDSEEEKNIINKEKEIKDNLNIVNNVCEFENKNIFERYNDKYNNDNEKFSFSQENKLKLNNNSINNNIDDLLNDIDKKKNNNYSKNENNNKNSNLSIINNI